MNASRPTSWSAAQRHEAEACPSAPSRSGSTRMETDGYKTTVLRFDKDMTEEDVDRQFLHMAHNLGIPVSRTTQRSIDDMTNDMATMSMSCGTPDASLSPTFPIPSMAPMTSSTPSHNPPPAAPSSDSSSDQHSDEKGHAAMTPSASSVVSSRTSVASVEQPTRKLFRKGFRRFTIKRRKSTGASTPALPLDVAITMDGRSAPEPQASCQSTPTINALAVKRTPTPHSSATFSPAPQPMQSPPPIPVVDLSSFQDSPASRHRSMRCQRLQDLRGYQLQEQLRFIRFERDQYRSIRSKYAASQREAIGRYEAQGKNIEDSHSQALVALEQRHLGAEADLVQTLENERRACETRLKHMQAYCSPKHAVEGMPERVVTKKDYNQLEAQYRLRENMDNLHTARINVLRERQAKQQERVLAKQENEMEALEMDKRDALQDLGSQREEEEQVLKNRFAARKSRLIARWSLSEAIECRKLENETGEAYGSLPPLPWADHDEDYASDAGSEHGSGGG